MNILIAIIEGFFFFFFFFFFERNKIVMMVRIHKYFNDRLTTGFISVFVQVGFETKVQNFSLAQFLL